METISKLGTGQDSGEKTVMSTHCSHCGGTCLLKVHVKDGVITRIEPGGVVTVRFAGENADRKLMLDYAPLERI